MSPSNLFYVEVAEYQFPHLARATRATPAAVPSARRFLLQHGRCTPSKRTIVGPSGSKLMVSTHVKRKQLYMMLLLDADSALLTKGAASLRCCLRSLV